MIPWKHFDEGINDVSNIAPKSWMAEMEMFSYEKERDIKRKNQVRALLSRTAEQMKEEEFLIQEVKRLESTHYTNKFSI
jgi:hypothetical protein